MSATVINFPRIPKRRMKARMDTHEINTYGAILKDVDKKVQEFDGYKSDLFIGMTEAIHSMLERDAPKERLLQELSLLKYVLSKYCIM